MIKIDGKYYTFDFDKVLEFVMNNSNGEKGSQQTILQQYGYPRNNMGEPMTDREFILLAKEVSEVKQTYVDINQNLKYDMCKTMITFLMDVSQSRIIDGVATKNVSLKDLSFGQIVVFNTLIKYGILKETEKPDTNGGK